MNYSNLLNNWLAWKTLAQKERYTHKRLSYDSGVSESTISHIINSGRKPETSTIEKIASALGITVAQLWQGPEVLKEKPSYEVTKRFLLPEDDFYRMKILKMVCKLEGAELKTAYGILKEFYEGTVKKNQTRTVRKKRVFELIKFYR